MKNILVIDDDKDFRYLIKHQLKGNDFTCFECATREQALELLATEKNHLVLCDLNLRKESGREVVIQMKESFPGIPVIIVTSYSHVKSAVELIRAGAVDYLLKPLIPAELAFIINKRIAEVLASKGRRAAPPTAPADDRTAPYVFSPGAFSKKILDQVDLVAPTNYSVIIYGESGSGKEAFAQEIHKRSKRRSERFFAIDCGALPKDLSNSILFGHEKGSFTGAIQEKEGVFEAAAGGTVFLDEIANLPYETQVSLLRVLQEKKIKRVGGSTDTPIDVRVIVASNKKLWEECKRGNFREDLFHRFNEFSIDIAPLREREDDIIFYAGYFLEQANIELRKNVTGFTEEAKTAILKYHWPGNLRELRNLIRRAVLITESATVGIDVLPAEFHPLNSPLRIFSQRQGKRFLNYC
jgi:two-component system, NtrC family, response regulator HydG